jgi:hypothetical protein
VTTDAQVRAELLDDLVKAVREGLEQEDQGCLKAAVNIKEIVDAKLWPQNLSLAEFLLTTFDLSVERANQLIAFVQVRDSIQGKTLPEKERQTRALRKTDETEWQSVWDRAVEKSGGKQPTGRLIELIIQADEKKRRALSQVTKKQEALDLERKEIEGIEDVEPNSVPFPASTENEEPDEDLDENDGEDIDEDTDAGPTDAFTLKIKLTVGGQIDFTHWEAMFRENYSAEKTNVRIADSKLGMKFDCSEGRLPILLHSLEDLLNEEIDSLRLEVEKQAVAAPVQVPVSV